MNFIFTPKKPALALGLAAALLAAGCNDSPTKAPGVDPDPTGPDTTGGDTTGIDTAGLDSLGNGIFLRIEGVDYVLTNADVYRFSPSGQRQITTHYAGTATFHGTGLNYGSVTVSNTLPADSVQTCGALATNAAIKLEFGSLGEWGGTYNATTCRLKIRYMSQAGGIEGVILGATFANTGGKTFSVRSGAFRVFRYKGFAGLAPAVTLTSGFLATLQIDSGSFELGAGQHFRLAKELVAAGGFAFGTATSDGNAQVDGNASDAISLRLLGTMATGPCGASTRDIQVALGTYQSEMLYKGTGAGASCAVTVEGQGNGAIRADYTGTLVAADNILPLARRTVKVSGSFRNYSLGVPLASANEALQADSLGASFNVGEDGSWHFPASGNYRLAASGQPFKPGGTPSFSVSFQRGRDTRSDLSFTLRYVPAATGAYACGATVPGTTVNQGYRTAILGTFSDTAYAGINYNAYAEIPASNCSITVSTYGASRIEGTYTATLVANGAKNLLPDGDTTVTVSGSFRANGLP